MEKLHLVYPEMRNLWGEFGTAKETIDECNSWCIVWGPPGGQLSPWNEAKRSVPGELEEVPPPVGWGPLAGFQPPCHTFPADPLRRLVSCSMEGELGLGSDENPTPTCRVNTQARWNAVTHLGRVLFQLLASSLNIC